MKFFKLFPLLIVLVAGCASGGRCVGEFEYQKAQTLPPVQEADGVKMPATGSSLRIPAEPKDPVHYAEYVSNPDRPGKKKVSCLDTPPAMPAGPPSPPADAAGSKP